MIPSTMLTIDNVCVDDIWKYIEERKDDNFTTEDNEEFTCKVGGVDGDKLIVIPKKTNNENKLSKNTFKKALKNFRSETPPDTPGALGKLRHGGSYIWTILREMGIL